MKRIGEYSTQECLSTVARVLQFWLFLLLREGAISMLRAVPFLGGVRINFRNFRGGFSSISTILGGVLVK